MILATDLIAVGQLVYGSAVWLNEQDAAQSFKKTTLVVPICLLYAVKKNQATRRD